MTGIRLPMQPRNHAITQSCNLQKRTAIYTTVRSRAPSQHRRHARQGRDGLRDPGTSHAPYGQMWSSNHAYIISIYSPTDTNPLRKIVYTHAVDQDRVLISDANPGLAAGDLLRGNQRPAGGARSPQSTTISHTVHAMFLRLHGTSCGLSLVGKGACNAAESWPVFSGEWDI